MEPITNSSDLKAYIQVLQSQMGLTDWQVELDTDATPDNNDAVAAIAFVFGRRLAHLTVSPGFYHTSAEQQRHYLVHELVHCHEAGVLEWLDRGLPELLGGLAFKAVEPLLRYLFERLTDDIALAWAPMLPLPLRRS